MQFNIDTKNGRAALDAIFKAVFGQKVPVVPLPADNPRNSSAFAYTCAVPDEKSNYFSFLELHTNNIKTLLLVQLTLHLTS
uniref:Uncharacterized protein n=1 Tax=Daphnia galeata TaxID=27404 RepID=A0A8J2S365_9CRUS|nr:unnamed protein product [Daphnia galeata]